MEQIIVHYLISGETNQFSEFRFFVESDCAGIILLELEPGMSRPSNALVCMGQTPSGIYSDEASEVNRQFSVVTEPITVRSLTKYNMWCSYVQGCVHSHMTRGPAILVVRALFILKRGHNVQAMVVGHEYFLSPNIIAASVCTYSSVRFRLSLEIFVGPSIHAICHV